MKRHRCLQGMLWLLVTAGAASAQPATTPVAASLPSPPPDSRVVQWARASAVHLNSVDAPYDERITADSRRVTEPRRGPAAGDLAPRGVRAVAMASTRQGAGWEKLVGARAIWPRRASHALSGPRRIGRH